MRQRHACAFHQGHWIWRNRAGSERGNPGGTHIPYPRAPPILWWSQYSPGFERQAVDGMLAGERVSELAKQLGARRKFLYQWRGAGYGSAGPQPPLRAVNRQRREVISSERLASTANQRAAELERLVGRQAAELDFFAAALRNIAAPPHCGVDAKRAAGV